MSPRTVSRRTAIAAVLLCLCAGLGAPGAARAQHVADPGIDLLRLEGAADYRDWMARNGWEDLRPITKGTKLRKSAERFRLEDGALRMASRKESFYIGSRLEGVLPVALDAYPYLRFVVRIERVPKGADLTEESLDDSAFRIFAVTRTRPIQTLVYAWSWSLPVGEWNARGFTGRGYYNNVRRKVFGQGPPLEGVWLTVEVNLREDFQRQFPEYSEPQLKALHLKTDSDAQGRARSEAWVRSVSLHRRSLRDEGLREGDALGDTVVWFR